MTSTHGEYLRTRSIRLDRVTPNDLDELLDIFYEAGLGVLLYKDHQPFDPRRLRVLVKAVRDQSVADIDVIGHWPYGRRWPDRGPYSDGTAILVGLRPTHATIRHASPELEAVAERVDRALNRLAPKTSFSSRLRAHTPSRGTVAKRVAMGLATAVTLWLFWSVVYVTGLGQDEFVQAFRAIMAGLGEVRQYFHV